MNLSLKFLVISLLFACLIPSETKSQDSSAPKCKIRLPQTINSYQPVIQPVLTIDGRMMFIDRKIHPDNINSVNDEDDIWISNKLNDVGWTEPYNPGSPLNTPYSDVLFSMSPDENRALVYGIYNKNGTKSPGFSLTRFENGKWKEPAGLKIENFYNDTSNYFANLSPDGRILLMSVKRKDTQGSLDLYVSFYNDSTKSFTEPMNLGDEVNSGGTEGSLFLAYDYKTLYFASNGLNGFGKFDIYVSRRLDNSWKKWSKPENLGKTINSQFDDNSIWLTALGDSLFYVSSDTATKRTGIYSACIPEEFRPEPYAIVRGTVYSYENNKMQPLNKRVEIEANYDNSSNTDFFYSNAELGSFNIALPGNTQCNFITNLDDYDSYSFSVATYKLKKPKYIDIDIVTKPKGESKKLVAAIYFDSNIDELNDSARIVIKNMLKNLLSPSETRLLVVGHTDEVGSDDFNNNLSVRRAEQTENYLESLGFIQSNIKIEGKGKTEPVSDDKAKNRRVEIYWVR